MQVDKNGLYRHLKLKPADQRLLENIIETTAKQEVIDFTEWVSDNYWIREPLPRITTGKVMWALYEDGKEDILKTTQQLYEEYKSQSKQEAL